MCTPLADYRNSLLVLEKVKKKLHFPTASLDFKKMAANVITNLEKQMPFIKAAGEKYATVRPAPVPIYSPNSPPFTKWTKLHSYNLTRREFWLTSTAGRMSHSGQQSAAQSSLVDLSARSVTVTKSGKEREKGGMNERVK